MKIMHVDVGGKKLPFRFSQRTFMAFEEKTGLSITELGENYKSKNVVVLALEALRTGHKIEDRQFDLDLDSLLDLDDKYDVIGEILKGFQGEEGKPMPSMEEN